MNYLLFESSLGFALFKINKLDKISLKDPKVSKIFDNFQDFKKIVSLEASFFFHGHNIAQETIQVLQKLQIPESLEEFLKTHLPKDKTLSLAVYDKSFAQELNSQLKIKCVSGELYMEIFRGIRQHLVKFLIQDQEEQITNSKITQANLGLGHALARDNIKFDEKKQDKAIINAYSLLEQMDKNLNTFCMRIKEGYGWHFPELAKIITDNESYTKLVNLIGNKKNLASMPLDTLEKIVGSQNLAQKILERYQSSMGNDLTEIDEKQLKNFSDYVIRHFQFKRDLQKYLQDEMVSVAPNLTAILGETLGAKLLTHSGGVKNLAKLPASTIQILGAEKALFRAIRKKGQTPKYGLLFNSSYISKAQTKFKGKISRMLANKCALASRLDYFLIKPVGKFGEFFKSQLEQRVQNPNNEELGKKNIEQMEKLIEEMEKEGDYLREKKISKKKQLKFIQDKQKYY